MSSSDETAAPTGLRFVVGVDGSEPSIAALLWAIDTARASGATIEAVAMWHFPAVGIERPAVGQRIHAETEAMLDAAVDRALSERPSNSISITRSVFQYPAADRLINMSSEADLIIVGRRARHGLGTLGSVSSRVVGHAHCPVVVIPPEP